jgi:hypothetical protein
MSAQYKEDQQSDAELIANALNLWANYVESGNVLLSANDAKASNKPFRSLGLDGMTLVQRLRELAEQVQSTYKLAFMSYSDLELELRGLPMTWYPALLAAMVEAAHAHHAFKPGRIHVYVKGIEDKCLSNQESCPELRTIEASPPTSQTTPRLKRSFRRNPAASG